MPHLSMAASCRMTLQATLLERKAVTDRELDEAAEASRLCVYRA
ncbi:MULTISPECIES: hypothetical protein [Paenibacillus]|nr:MULTISPECIES: hypothetical protein [Paenibacillus]